MLYNCLLFYSIISLKQYFYTDFYDFPKIIEPSKPSFLSNASREHICVMKSARELQKATDPCLSIYNVFYFKINPN